LNKLFFPKPTHPEDVAGCRRTQAEAFVDCHAAGSTGMVMRIVQFVEEHRGASVMASNWISRMPAQQSTNTACMGLQADTLQNLSG